MEMREMVSGDRMSLLHLIAAYRVFLAAMQGRERTIDLVAAEQELTYYCSRKYPVFVGIGDDGEVIGYIVCKVDDAVVWAEALYVRPEYRRLKVGSALFNMAEAYAKDLGGMTLYTWIHPQNHQVIAFLRKQGYDVLNLVELRRPLEGEQLPGAIKVGQHHFRYPSLTGE